MDKIYQQIAMVIKLRFEMASLDYKRAKADLAVLENDSDRDLAVEAAYLRAQSYINNYESVWGVPA